MRQAVLGKPAGKKELKKYQNCFTLLRRLMISEIAITGWVSGLKCTVGGQIFLLYRGRNMGDRSISCGAPL